MNKIINILLSKKVIFLIAIIFICLSICFISKKIILKLFSLRSKNVDIKKKKTIVNLISNIIRLFVIAVGGILILQNFGVDTGSLVASLGVFSLVIGLAIQDVLKDFISGIYLIFEGQLNIGDWVKIGDFKGEVLPSNFRTTKLKAYTGEIKIISNRNITEIINYSLSNSAAIIDVSVAYESDITKVKKVLDEVCVDLRTNNDVSDISCLGIEQLADSSIIFRIVAFDEYCKSISLARFIKEKIIIAFNNNSIVIPYFQVVVHNE